jgi:hypothetical protein
MIESHSTVREGAIAGVIGAAVIAFWYFVLDLLAGRPLATPNAIAERMFGVGTSDAGNVGTLAVVTVVHTVVFVVFGTALAAMVHLAARDIAWRMGVLLAFVIGLGFFSGLGFAANMGDQGPVPAWKALGGGFVAIAAMSIYLWRSHPALARSFADVPLGDETDSVPHAPDR